MSSHEPPLLARILSDETRALLATLDPNGELGAAISAEITARAVHVEQVANSSSSSGPVPMADDDDEDDEVVIDMAPPDVTSTATPPPIRRADSASIISDACKLMASVAAEDSMAVTAQLQALELGLPHGGLISQMAAIADSYQMAMSSHQLRQQRVIDLSIAEAIVHARLFLVKVGARVATTSEEEEASAVQEAMLAREIAIKYPDPLEDRLAARAAVGAPMVPRHGLDSISPEQRAAASAAEADARAANDMSTPAWRERKHTAEHEARSDHTRALDEAGRGEHADPHLRLGGQHEDGHEEQQSYSAEADQALMEALGAESVAHGEGAMERLAQMDEMREEREYEAARRERAETTPLPGALHPHRDRQEGPWHWTAAKLRQQAAEVEARWDADEGADDLDASHAWVEARWSGGATRREGSKFELDAVESAASQLAKAESEERQVNRRMRAEEAARQAAKEEEENTATWGLRHGLWASDTPLAERLGKLQQLCEAQAEAEARACERHTCAQVSAPPSRWLGRGTSTAKALVGEVVAEQRAEGQRQGELARLRQDAEAAVAARGPVPAYLLDRDVPEPPTMLRDVHDPDDDGDGRGARPKRERSWEAQADDED